MKYLILILLAVSLLVKAPDIRAHNLVGVSGNTQGHQHVYRRQQYGKPLQQGHIFQSSGESRMILWGMSARSDYGKPNVRRRGSAIEDQYPIPGVIPNASKKYGSAVKGYGKAVKGYGKPDRGK